MGKYEIAKKPNSKRNNLYDWFLHEKKERNRVFAEERSNLKEISDLGNLTRGITEFTNDSNYGNTKHRERERDTDGWEGRFDNGKRKRGVDMGLERGGTRRVREGTKIRKI